MYAASDAELARPFVAPDSIVRAIWGDADTILLVFAGAAAEFALNRAVDWLFFTNALPRDPIGRLFATAAHAQQIVFADCAAAHQTLARIARIHRAVERQRGQRIPDWAHRDVLYLLIAYSEQAYALHRRPLTPAERDELYSVFRRVGESLGVEQLPATYAAWQRDRAAHLRRDLAYSLLTRRLYRRYREVLGWWRYSLILAIQGIIVPPEVRGLLGLRPWPFLRQALGLYRVLVRLGLRPLIHRALIPKQYLAPLRRMDAPGLPS